MQSTSLVVFATLAVAVVTTYAYNEEDGILVLTNDDFEQAKSEFKDLVVTICEYIESDATAGNRLYQLILVNSRII
jgi:hypothetical protein